MIHKFTTVQGFSLVEVLVAVSLLMVAVVGPMTVLTRATNSTTFATEQATAFFLAQEGLELVQKGRDDLVLDAFEYQYDGTGVNDPITRFDTQFASCLAGTGCNIYVDSTAAPSVTIQSCASLSNCQLRTRTGVTTVRPIYVHGATGTLTPYTRVIRIVRTNEASGRAREYRVTSTVSWRSGSFIANQSVTLDTYLANTYDNN